MSEDLERLEIILQAASDSEEKRREAWLRVEEKLKCPVCGWIQNEGRIVPENLRLVLEYLPGWIGRAHRHYFRHAYWNRFPYSPRFVPEITLEERESIYGSNPNPLKDLAEEITFEIVPLAPGRVRAPRYALKSPSCLSVRPLTDRGAIPKRRTLQAYPYPPGMWAKPLLQPSGTSLQRD